MNGRQPQTPGERNGARVSVRGRAKLVTRQSFISTTQSDTIVSRHNRVLCGHDKCSDDTFYNFIYAQNSLEVSKYILSSMVGLDLALCLQQASFMSICQYVIEPNYHPNFSVSRLEQGHVELS
jgi:hypothetical protein